MNLNTGKRVHCRNWTDLPMPDEVIQRVEQLGKKDNQPKLLINIDKTGDVLFKNNEQDIKGIT